MAAAVRLGGPAHSSHPDCPAVAARRVPPLLGAAHATPHVSLRELGEQTRPAPYTVSTKRFKNSDLWARKQGAARLWEQVHG